MFLQSYTSIRMHGQDIKVLLECISIKRGILCKQHIKFNQKILSTNNNAIAVVIDNSTLWIIPDNVVLYCSKTSR